MSSNSATIWGSSVIGFWVLREGGELEKVNVHLLYDNPSMHAHTIIPFSCFNDWRTRASVPQP